MIKLRSYRIETGEIENVAMTYPGIIVAVCVVKQVAGEDQLCLYFEASDTVDTAQLKDTMARNLADYMMPEFLIQLDELPRNARGKIDRKAIPEPVRQTELLMIAPATESERMLHKIIAEMFGTDQFGVTDNLFTVGMTSIMAMKVAAEAQRLGMTVKGTDIIRLKTICKVLQNQLTMMGWFNNYDESRPTIVFTHGISIISDVYEKLKIFGRHYNVFTIEPIHEHYHYIFEGEPMEEVVELYFAMLDIYLPVEARVAAFAGASYGGKITYQLACKWAAEKGQKPAVVMGDSILVDGPKFARLYKEGKNNMQNVEEAMRERLKVTLEIDYFGENIPPYDGQVILLHSTLPSRTGLDNLAAWRTHASNLHIIPIALTHNEICVDNPLTLPCWEQACDMINK